VRVILYALVFASLIVTPAQAADLTPDPARLDAYLRSLETYGYSGAILVSRGDDVLLSSGYGLAEEASSAKITPRTLFSIASLSKTITAAAILALEEDGKITLDDPLSKFFPDIPKTARTITIRQLLTHTSGLPDWPGESARMTRDEFVRALLAQPREDTGGLSFYSNSGYTLLGAILEVASGEVFADFVRKRIFEPAGMSSSGFSWEWARFSGAPLVHPRGTIRNDTPLAGASPWPFPGASGVLTCTEDLHRFSVAVKSGKILRAKNVARFLSPYADISKDFYFKYGFGWRHQRDEAGRPVIWHSGYDGDFSSLLIQYADVEIIALWNSSIDLRALRDVFLRTRRPGPYGLIGEALFERTPESAPPAAQPLDARKARNLIGVYEFEGGGAFQVAYSPSGVFAEALSMTAARTLFPAVAAETWATVESALGDLNAALGDASDASRRGDVLSRIGPIDPYDLWGGAGVDDVLKRWNDYERVMGPLKSVRALAAAPISEDSPEEYWSALLELTFERGVAHEKYVHWTNGEAYVFPGAPQSLRLFVGETENGLIGADLLGRGVVAFDASSRNRLRLGENAAVIAKRISKKVRVAP
jgi:CubicO group peptidase (beta-lactamase class C family)